MSPASRNTTLQHVYSGGRHYRVKTPMPRIPPHGGLLVIRLDNGKMAKIAPAGSPQPAQSEPSTEEVRRGLERERRILTMLNDTDFVPFLDQDSLYCKLNRGDVEQRDVLITEDVGETSIAVHLQRERENCGQDDAEYTARVKKITVRLIEAMQLFHRRGILHRDIKTDHIRVVRDPSCDEGLRLIFLDWANGKHPNSPEPTGEGTAEPPGTRGYASPQAWTGARTHIDERDDIFSLAATIYNAATGRDLPLDYCPSWYADPSNAVPRQASAFQKDIRSHLRDSLADRHLVEVLVRALTLDKHDRYADADAVLRDLRRPLSLGAIITALSRAAERFGRLLRSQSGLRNLPGGLLAVLVLLAAWISFASSAGMVSWGGLVALVALAALVRVEPGSALPRVIVAVFLAVLWALYGFTSTEPCTRKLILIPLLLAASSTALEPMAYACTMSVALAACLGHLPYAAPLVLAVPLIIGVNCQSPITAAAGAGLSFVVAVWSRQTVPTALWDWMSSSVPLGGFWGMAESTTCSLSDLLVAMSSPSVVLQAAIWMGASFLANRVSGSPGKALSSWAIGALLPAGATLAIWFVRGERYPWPMYAALLMSLGVAWFFGYPPVTMSARNS